MMASKRNGTLYVGVTNNLLKRVGQHKSNAIDGFTKKYSVHSLVYFEETMDISSAISREKQFKSWQRNWKIKLIEDKNPDWKDLYFEMLDPESSSG